MIRTKRAGLGGIARLMVIVAAAALLAGCAVGEGFERFRGELVQLREQLAADQNAWQDRLTAMQPDDPRRGGIQAELSSATAQLAAVDAAVAHADLIEAEAEHPTDPISRLVGAVAPWLPEPVRTPLALTAALVATAVRARQLKKGAASIAASIRRVMLDDPQLADSLGKHAATLRSIQTPTAARIVDELDPARRMLRLPI